MEVVKNAITSYKRHIEMAGITWDTEDALEYVREALADETGVDVEYIDADSTQKLITVAMQ